MPRKYTKESITDTGWSEWLTPENPDEYRIACCDCGLVHIFQLRAIVKVRDDEGAFTIHDLEAGELPPNEEIGIALRAKRDNRATGQIRRRKRENGERLNYD